MGLSLNAKYLGNDGQPLWKKEVEAKLLKRYGKRNKDKSIPKKAVFKEFKGKKFKIKEEK